MNIVVIGGGNMGSAIVRGLLQGSQFQAKDITVVDVNQSALDALKKDFPDLKVKVPDSDVGPYDDGKNRHQHKFGPYQGIIIPAKKAE